VKRTRGAPGDQDLRTDNRAVRARALAFGPSSKSVDSRSHATRLVSSPHRAFFRDRQRQAATDQASAGGSPSRPPCGQMGSDPVHSRQQGARKRGGVGKTIRLVRRRLEISSTRDQSRHQFRLRHILRPNPKRLESASGSPAKTGPRIRHHNGPCSPDAASIGRVAEHIHRGTARYSPPQIPATSAGMSGTPISCLKRLSPATMIMPEMGISRTGRTPDNHFAASPTPPFFRFRRSCRAASPVGTKRTPKREERSVAGNRATAPHSVGQGFASGLREIDPSSGYRHARVGAKFETPSAPLDHIRPFLIHRVNGAEIGARGCGGRERDTSSRSNNTHFSTPRITATADTPA